MAAGCFTAAYRTSAPITFGSARRLWGLVHLRRRNQKLFPHFDEAGTAVFAVQEVEYGGHDLASLFVLHQ